MLKKIINTALIKIRIIPIDPILIKSGQATVGGTDMAFVRTYRSGEHSEPFLPGSSLKGMIRSYAEKICRSLHSEPVPVCLPYQKPPMGRSLPVSGQASCGLCLGKIKEDFDIKELPSASAYKVSCATCRLFGSLEFAGRFSVSDGCLTDQFKNKFVTEIRDGVAIDRLTGSTAGGAKFDLEVLTRGEFETHISIRNFERWQVGLIGLILRDMEDSLLRIGFGKSRGLGGFKIEIPEFKLTSYGTPMPVLCGISKRCSDKENMEYGFAKECQSGNPVMPDPEIKGLRYEYDITSDWKSKLEPAVTDFVEFIRSSHWPGCLETLYRNRGRV